MYKVLLVEDSTVIREMITEMLDECPKLAITGVATTSLDAIRLLDTQQYDLILLDIELAQGTGFDVVSHMRQQNFHFKVPDIVMLTNHGNSYYRNLASKMGVKYFFDKSLQFDECMTVIQEHANSVH